MPIKTILVYLPSVKAAQNIMAAVGKIAGPRSAHIIGLHVSQFGGSSGQRCRCLETVMRTAISCFVVILSIWWAGGSQAQTPDDIAAGRRIAERLCARCHAIGRQGQSTHPSAPPFRQIVAKGNVENLEEALGEGIVVGHPDMPQFQFKPQDVGALIAYLKSLSGKG